MGPEMHGTLDPPTIARDPREYTEVARARCRASFRNSRGCSLCRPAAIPETLPEPERWRHPEALQSLRIARVAALGAKARRRRKKNVGPMLGKPAA